MHALVPRAGLAGKRASAARDLTDADCPRQPVVDRQPRAVVYQRLARLSLRRRYRLAEQPRGAYDGRLRDRRVRRQRRQYARRGVVEALRRGGACGPEACLAAARGRQQHVRRPLVHRCDAPGPGASRRQRADRVGHRACAVHVLYMPCVVRVCVVRLLPAWATDAV